MADVRTLYDDSEAFETVTRYDLGRALGLDPEPHRTARVDASGGAGDCSAHVDVDLTRDDQEGPVPHAFGCDLSLGHEGVHSAAVTWLDGEE